MPCVQETGADTLRAIKREDIAKLFVAINKTDVTSPEDLVDCERHNRTQLANVGVGVQKIHKFSAKIALSGDVGGSGLQEFIDDLGDFFERDSGRIMAEKLKNEVISAASLPLQSLATRIASNGKTAQEIALERTELAQQRKHALSKAEGDEKKFSQIWENAICEAEMSLPSARDRMRMRMGQEVESANLTQIGKLAKNLPKKFNQILEEEAGPSLAEMETKLAQACQSLQAAYPRVDITSGGLTKIITAGSTDTTFTKGVLGGSAALIGGIGIAGAASSALAAATVTTTVVAPAAAAVASIAGVFSSGLASFITGLGTSTVTAAAPSALLVAAGPLGLALAGIGALAIPLTWRIARKKKKAEIADQVEEQVNLVFKNITQERIPAFRSFGPRILNEFRSIFERRIQTIDDGLALVATRAGSLYDDAIERQRYERLASLLSNPPSTSR